MGINVGELFVSLGFDVDDKKLTAFNDQFKSGVSDVQKYSDKVKEFSTNALTNATSMKNFTAQTGFATDALQKYAIAASRLNPAISLEQARNQYATLAQNLISLNRAQGPSGILAQLGLTSDDTKNPEKAFEFMSRAWSRTKKERGVGVANQLIGEVGIGGWGPVLDKSRQEIDKLAEGLVVPQEDIDKLNAVSTNINDFGIVWNKIKSSIISFFVDGTDAMYGLKNLKPIPIINEENRKKLGEQSAVSLPAPDSAGTQNYIQRSMDYFMAAGASAGRAAGITANLVDESGGDPRAIGDTNLARGPSRGLFQLSPYRQKKLFNDTGIDISTADFGEQLKGALFEMKQSGVWDKIQAAPESESAGIMTRLFENPARPDKEAAERSEIAQKILNMVPSNKTANITINSNANPQEIAKEVQGILQKEFSDTGATVNLGPSF